MNNAVNNPYDCIVIGAGPAGLSAGIMLARYGRRFLIFDDSRPRNGAARSVHGFLGHDGIAAKDLLRKGREELCRYGGDITHDLVKRVIRADESFMVVSSQTYVTQTVLLATGVKDILPAIAGFEDFYGATIFHCPECDGYEIRDRHVAVLGDSERVEPLLKALRVWTSRLTLLSNGEEKRITAFEGNSRTRQIENIRFEDGTVLPCDAVFFDLGLHPASPLLQGLGCEFDSGKHFINVGRDQQTTVPGVYAAGDITPDSHMAVVAAAEGTMAAIQIHKALLRIGR